MRDELTEPGRALVLVCLAASLSMGTTCNGNQDFLLPGEPIELKAEAQENMTLGQTLTATIEHSESYDARNTLDFVLTNTGATDMIVGLGAFSSSSSDLDEAAANTCDEDASGDVVEDTVTQDTLAQDTVTQDATEDATPDADQGGGFIPDLPNPLDGLDLPTDCIDSTGQFTFTIPPGESVVGRFTESQLGTGVAVILVIQCRSDQCEGTLEYTLLQSQLECRRQSDCAADETCDDQVGRCVLTSESCQASPTSIPGGAAPWLVIGAGLLLLWGLRRRDSLPRLGGPTAALLVAVGISLVSADAEAQRLDFDKASAQTALGFGMRSWTGILAGDARAGLALDWSQSLQYRYLGGHIGVGTAFFLTNQIPPPSAKGMQTYSLHLGPRFLYPWRSFRFFIDAEYERLGVISNALVRKTGQDLSFNAAGLAGGVRWYYGPVLIGARAGYTQVFEFDAGLITATLNVGIVGQL